MRRWPRLSSCLKGRGGLSARAFEGNMQHARLPRIPRPSSTGAGTVSAHFGRSAVERRSGGGVPAEILSRWRPRSRVNSWLSRLSIPYTIDAATVMAEDVTTTLGDVVLLVLTRRSGLKVSPGDVGFGISQLLPIVVQTLVGSDTTICIEQPEIHVHPRLQAEMADLFVEAVGDSRANQLIIETHSEHLMLRVQRHVERGRISPEDIAVLYVDTDEHGASTVLRLRLDSDGSFIDEWPHGFFEERFDEVFGAE